MDLCGVLLGWGGGDMVWGAIWTSKVGTCMNALYICSFIYVLVFMFFCSFFTRPKSFDYLY